MNGRTAKLLRRAAQNATVGKPIACYDGYTLNRNKPESITIALGGCTRKLNKALKSKWR